MAEVGKLLEPMGRIAATKEVIMIKIDNLKLWMMMLIYLIKSWIMFPFLGSTIGDTVIKCIIIST